MIFFIYFFFFYLNDYNEFGGDAKQELHNELIFYCFLFFSFVNKKKEIWQ